MQRYIGTKLINAKPMTRLEYNTLRGWTLPENENGDDAGFLVEYVDGGKANMPDAFQGYVSWSPAEVFNLSYQPVDGLSFGLAIDLIKKGAKVARAGWNAQGMWIAYGKGHDGLPYDAFWNKHARNFAIENGGFAPVQDYILIKTASGQISMGWVASQSDILANDWFIVE